MNIHHHEQFSYTKAGTNANGDFTTSAPLNTSNGTGTGTISAFDYLSGVRSSVSVTVTPAITPVMQLTPGSATVTFGSTPSYS